VGLADRLRSVGLKFQEKNGMLTGTFGFPDGRTQAFFLDPDEDQFFDFAEYDFTSVVGPATDPQKVKAACEIVGGLKRGGIIVKQGLIILKFEVPVSLPDRALAAQVSAVCLAADNMEKTLFGGDNW
jgi:hypothetical protein